MKFALSVEVTTQHQRSFATLAAINSPYPLQKKFQRRLKWFVRAAMRRMNRQLSPASAAALNWLRHHQPLIGSITWLARQNRSEKVLCKTVQMQGQ
jgi:hypothetical protein